ncbi:MAG: hypothetical protein AB1689_11895 [Thermodesulfobacteriota bacterium]
MLIHGRLIALFSFDVGYEILLDRARALLAEGTSGEIERRRAAPAYVAYAAPPLRVPLGTHEVTVLDERCPAAAGATVHDIGAVTIALQWEIARDIDSLPALTAHLLGTGALEATARGLLESLVRRIGPAVIRPNAPAFVEDYYVVQIDPSGLPPMEELVSTWEGSLAATLRGEPHALAPQEASDVLGNRFSYYPDDLIVTDWNVAVVIDRDYADAVTVLEFLNVQLVELRHYDARLDALVASFYGLSAQPGRWLSLTYRPYRRTVQELGAMRLDVATIVERVHNALKLSGSLYLAKIYARTSERLGLRVWEESVARKLEVLQEIYEVLVQRTATARAELLELTIIVLILFEIVLFLVGV